MPILRSVSLTTWEAHHSSRAKPDDGYGELPRSLMRQLWTDLRFQFLFYHDEIKLVMNKCQKLSQTVPWLQHGYMCTSWGHVTWLFFLGNTCSNHCDVTVRFVTINVNQTLHHYRQQNICFFLENRSKLIKMFQIDIFKIQIYKLFARVKYIKDVIKYTARLSKFIHFLWKLFSRVTHSAHSGRGHGSLTCHMTQFERPDWLGSANFINTMLELVPSVL